VIAFNWRYDNGLVAGAGTVADAGVPVDLTDFTCRSTDSGRLGLRKPGSDADGAADDLRPVFVSIDAHQPAGSRNRKTTITILPASRPSLV